MPTLELSIIQVLLFPSQAGEKEQVSHLKATLRRQQQARPENDDTFVAPVKPDEARAPLKEVVPVVQEQKLPFHTASKSLLSF